jgi:hypothetical protein
MNTENTRSLPHWHATESLLLRTRRHNVLIEGPVDATSAALLQMQPHIREPIVWKPPQAPLELPGSKPSALILENIAALSAGTGPTARVAWRPQDAHASRFDDGPTALCFRHAR